MVCGPLHMPEQLVATTMLSPCQVQRTYLLHPGATHYRHSLPETVPICLADATCPVIRAAMHQAVKRWCPHPYPSNVLPQVMRRDNRSGFKAGAMVEGLNRVEGLGYEYCAIFDAGVLRAVQVYATWRATG